jgi:hypothetical protein
MRNPWLAIDVSTSPVVRAREVGLAREALLRGPARGDGSPLAYRGLLAALCRSRHRPQRVDGCARGRRAGGARALRRASARPPGTRPARLARSDLGRGGAPRRGHRCRRAAALGRRRPTGARAGGGAHGLRRGSALERAGGGNERNRHRAGDRPRGPGLRRGALRRADAEVDVRRGAGPRPGVRAAAGRGQSDRADGDGPSAQPRPGHGHGADARPTSVARRPARPPCPPIADRSDRGRPRGPC